MKMIVLVRILSEVQELNETINSFYVIKFNIDNFELDMFYLVIIRNEATLLVTVSLYYYLLKKSGSEETLDCQLH